MWIKRNVDAVEAKRNAKRRCASFGSHEPRRNTESEREESMTSAMRCRSSHSAVGPQASSTSYAAVAAASRPSKRAGVRRVASSRPAPRRACAHLGPQELLLLADAVLDTASGLAASGANEVAASGATEALASEALASGANEVAAAAPAATPSLGTFGGDTGSYWASLGLVILTAPGLWSLVKRSPKASVKSMTFQVPAPPRAAPSTPSRAPSRPTSPSTTTRSSRRARSSPSRASTRPTAARASRSAFTSSSASLRFLSF